MPLTVFKYPVDVSDTIYVKLPAGAQPLTFAMQRDQLCLWALVSPDLPSDQTEAFIMAGTGHEIQHNASDLRYVATVFLPIGPGLVFHFFHLVLMPAKSDHP